MEKLCFFTIVVLLSVNYIAVSSAKRVHNSITDEEAVLAFKSGITSDPNNILVEYWLTNTSVCNWIGISCSIKRQRITAFNISGFGFQGTIVPHLGNLTLLVYLDMSINNLTGMIPLELSNLRRMTEMNLGFNRLAGTIPFGIFILSSLRVLDLRDNSLSGMLSENICSGVSKLAVLYLLNNQLYGPIPSNIHKCRYLHDLSLSNNHFNGSIPSTIGSLTMLRSLNMGINNFVGGIPLEIGNLSNLEILGMQDISLTGPIPSLVFNISLRKISFANNSLSGSLPPDFCHKLPALEVLYLDSNELTGQVSHIFECKRLQVISLSDNKFTGVIHAKVGNLTELQHVYLHNNQLTGELPAELGNLNLLALFVYNNGLFGPIPFSIFNISTLQVLEVSYNQFSGHLPSTIGLSLPNLEELYLESNRLIGKIPSSIINASKLTLIDMGQNALTGVLPNFGNLRLLRRLLIGGNNLTVESRRFFSSLTNCLYLDYLEVSENQVSGALPASIGNLSTSLQVFRAFECNIHGAVPTEIGNLSSLINLNFAGNQLTGFIPKTIGKLISLQGLYFVQNKLHGDIPTDLCRLINLADLVLGENMLSGSIPACLVELKSLRTLILGTNKFETTLPLNFWSLNDLLILNLSSNNLRGSLPSEIQNFKAVNKLDLSWNKFSGKIPTSIGDMQSLSSLSLTHNQFQGSIPESLGKIRSLVSLDLSYNQFSGSIPKSLEELADLQNFDASHNRLEGEIPVGGCFANFSTQSFMENYALCSETRKEFPPCRNSSSKAEISLMKYILPPLLLVILAMIVIILIVRRRKSNTLAACTDIPPLLEFRRISFRELQEATNAFSESNILGSGSFGSVYGGALSDGLNVAVKVFNLQTEEARATRSFAIESQLLSSIRHRNLVRVIGCCSNEEFKALILEYMPNGSLEKWLYSHSYFLDTLKRLNIAIDVALALEYLHHGHTSTVVHCDLKPSNVLLDDDMVAHVADFGIAKIFGEGELMAQTKTLATIGYISPEYGAEGIVTTSGDVYSYGIMLMEIWTRKKPTDEMFDEQMSLKSWVSQSLDKNNIIEVMDSNLLPEEEENFSKKKQCVSSILALAIECSIDAPAQRITMREVVARLQKVRATFLAR